VSVYVDQLSPTIRSAKWRHNKACHLYADDVKELHAFAVLIGQKPWWFQNRPGFPHYDLTAGMRSRALLRGAIEHDKFQMVEFMRRSKSCLTKGDTTALRS
jgi:hypothetical protein